MRLELFGLALRDDFDAQSDVDVLVMFEAERRPGLSDPLEIEKELEVTFSRHTDVIERRLMEANRNWVRRRSILQSAQTIYAAA